MSEETTPPSQAAHWREIGPFALLFALLVAVLSILPLFSATGWGELAQKLAWTSVILVAIWTTESHRRVLRLGIAVALPGLVLRWISTADNAVSFSVAANITLAFFVGFIVVQLTRRIFEADEIKTDQLLGAINVFLLMGVLYGQLHGAAELSHPGAYEYKGKAVSEVADYNEEALQDLLLYFSFTTLTTLGYGDIHPTTQATRALSTSEAIFGQLFIATMIARLVSMRALRRPD